MIKIIANGRADSAAWSKANYEKDVEASHTCKRSRYATLCASSLLIYIMSSIEGTL